MGVPHVQERVGVVKGATMKHPKPAAQHRRTTPSQRAAFLHEFKRSGLAAAAFAREHGIGYSTFFHWRRQARAACAPAFVEVDLPPAPSAEGLVIELGPAPRLRLTSVHQVALAAQLLQALQAPTPC